MVVWTTISLAVVPIIVGYIVSPDERSRWMLAQAAIKYDRGEVEQAQRLIDESLELSDTNIVDVNFWRLMARIHREDSNQLLSVFESLVKKTDNRFIKVFLARNIADLLYKSREFKRAVEVLECHLPTMLHREWEDNNMIAYFRSLVGGEEQLAIAEKEIDVALGFRPKEESLLDTKAWILHGLGRNEEAIVPAEIGVERCLAVIRKHKASVIYQWIDPKRLSDLEVPKTGYELIDGRMFDPIHSEITSSRYSGNISLRTKAHVAAMYQKLQGGSDAMGTDALYKMLRQVAVLRYHRMVILTDLSRHDEASADQAWLEHFGFDDEDDLN